MVSNYKKMADRIRKANSPNLLKSLDKKIDQLYKFGVFSVNERRRLDSLLVDSSIALEEKMTTELINGLVEKANEILNQDTEPHERTSQISELFSGVYRTFDGKIIDVAVNSVMTTKNVVVKLNSVLYQGTLHQKVKPKELIEYLRKYRASSKL